MKLLEALRMPLPGAERPRPFAGDQPDSKLNISVIFTNVASTLAALKHAGDLASNLGARITLLVPQVVPYPLALTNPTVSPDLTARRFRVIAGSCMIETRVTVYLCRDRAETLKTALKPRSLVVLGGRKSWWPTSENRLAAGLRRAGHEVMFFETE